MIEFIKNLLNTFSEFLAFLREKRERQDKIIAIRTEIQKNTEKVVKEKTKTPPKEPTDENFFGD